MSEASIKPKKALNMFWTSNKLHVDSVCFFYIAGEIGEPTDSNVWYLSAEINSIMFIQTL